MSRPRRLFRPVLLAAALCAANLAVAALPASAPFSPAQQQAIRQISASEAQAQVPLVASAAAANVAKTIEGEKQAIAATKEYLELGRKNVDWWLGFLSLLLAAAAFFVWRTNERSRQEWDDLQKGITSEHLQNMKDAAEARKELRQEMQDCIKDAKERFDQHLKLTETSVDILKRDLEQARKMLSEIEQHRDSALAPPADAAPEIIEAAMQTNQSNAAHSPQSKLAAIAQQFGKNKNWQEAASRWQALTDLEPENRGYWFNYGYVLSEWVSQLTEPLDVQRLAKQADTVWRKTIELQATAVAYYNWGNVLSEWAKTLTGGTQQQRFAEADQRYAEATRLAPDNADAYNNWGIALLHWAFSLADEARQQRFAEAGQRFAEATRLQPDYADAYNNWGSAFVDWALTLQGDEREAKLNEAERVLLLAKEKGLKSPYNLACLRAVQQRPDEARALLEETRSAGLLPDFAHLSSDRDLENLRELDWFQALLEEVKQQEAGNGSA